MSQHPIDLLPDALRARSQAGVRTGRYVAAGVLGVLALVVATTTSRLQLHREMNDLASLRIEADLVLQTEQKANMLREQLADVEEYIDLYRRVALPLDLTAIIATVVNELPTTTTLDRLVLDANQHRNNRTARQRGGKPEEKRQRRVLIAELSGFAVSDSQISELVNRLRDRAPFHDVTLDFSRTRTVRGQTAREFRVSFRIDLDAAYDVTMRDTALGSAGGSEEHFGHVN